MHYRNMFRFKRINTYPKRGRRRRGVAVLLPWIFVSGIAAGTALPIRAWLGLPPTLERSATQRRFDETWQQAAVSGTRHSVEVLRILDGDTFEARVLLWPDLVKVTRVRLRGIDAAEMNSACSEEHRLAVAATDALRTLLAEGEVTIFNLGPDKYAGRVVADAATTHTPSISAALLGTGLVRAYQGGRRHSWCANASR